MVVPLFSTLLISISALCCDTKCLTIASPNPVPPTLRLLLGSTVKKRSVILCIDSFGMPIPWSAIETIFKLPSFLSEIVTSLFLSLYLIALSIRLVKISINLSLSPIILKLSFFWKFNLILFLLTIFSYVLITYSINSFREDSLFLLKMKKF